MPSLLGSILKSINCESSTKLNILTINHNETYQTMLAKTGHNFFVMHHPQLRGWDVKIRPYVENWNILFGNSVSSQFRADGNFDLILCQSRDQQFSILAQLATQLSCPIINIEYSLSSPEANPHYIESLTYQPYNAYVFGSEFVANSWGFDTDDKDVHVITHGVDTNFFDGWHGGDGKVLTVVRDYPNRNNITGFDLYQAVIQSFQANPHGESLGISKSTKNVDELLKIYQQASVFLNTSTWHPCPLALLEAMSVGCPVVTTSSAMLDEIIEDGVNGFIANEPETVKAKLQECINDQEMAKSLGEQARKTIVEKFGEKQFVDSWQAIFRSSIGQASAIITN